MTKTNPAHDLAISYIARKWPIFPCRAKPEEAIDPFTGKPAHDPETGEIEIAPAKSPYTTNGLKSASTFPRIIDRWWRDWPDAMVGIPTGAKIGAWVLDIDVKTLDDGTVVNGFERLNQLIAANGPLPETARVRTPRGGVHYYFENVPGIRNKQSSKAETPLGDLIDVRGEGGFVISAGSRMADGRAYEWIDGDNDNIPAILPAPQWLVDIVIRQDRPEPTPGAYQRQTSRGLGANPSYVNAAVEMELDHLASTGQGGRGEQLNTSAFVLGTFVGADALSRSDAEAGLYAAAAANGGLAKDGQKETLAKIKRGLDAGQRSPRDIPLPSIGYEDDTKIVPVTRMIEVARAKIRAKNETPVAVLEAMTEDEKEEYSITSASDLASLTNPGGLVSDLIEWIISSAEQPSRELALAAVLPLVATLMGSRYSTGSRDTRPNLYTVALAESGFGKEHARSQIKRLFLPETSYGVFDKLGGPSRIMSASALREMLEASPSLLCQIDEFGGFVRSITDRRAGGHQQAISTDLRDYYSASSTYFEGAAYRGSAPKRVYNPNLCIHGTSTPDQFWTALSSASAEDGLLPRLILFHIDGPKPVAVKPEQDVRYVPSILVQRMADVAGIDVVRFRTSGSPKAAIDRTKQADLDQVVIPWDPGALDVFNDVKDYLDDTEMLVAPEARPFVRRVIENSVKLAMIVSVGIDHRAPRITGPVMDWAAKLAWTCAAAMITQVSERLSDNEREANYKKISGLVRAAGEKGITRGRLGDRLKGIDARRRDEIISDLKAAGKVEERTNAGTGGRNSVRLFWGAG